MVNFVYGDLNNILFGGTTPTIMEYFEDRGISNPLDESVHEINLFLLNQVHLPSYIYRSIDLIIKDSANDIPEEILSSIQPPGFPRHLIELKRMTPVILFINLNFAKRLCNGTRLLVCEVRGHMLVCTIMTGWWKGTTVFLPKIKLHYEENKDYGIFFSRYQFPMALAYAITINNAQGQSFGYFGVGFLTSTTTSPPFKKKRKITKIFIKTSITSSQPTQSLPRSCSFFTPLLFPSISPPLVPILKTTLQFMSPSPARSKPPPSQLALLMNPTPDPPDEDDHMIVPEIYEREPGFLTQSQYVDQLNTLANILQKLENLEKRETNVNLPANL
ncbi:hypothetical protein O181_000923 [Austropuccinia psidii MF-1]|uniref:DNA helicase Pif1-like 2B domain-containing protein n=1 Tax=Austropuccinia psidii MF-1 TaxID=1389203 RepID=A0A9Q3B9G9_9BASI|nr:hypothetical protein [Austropuccinia psidii MF-1]